MVFCLFPLLGTTSGHPPFLQLRTLAHREPTGASPVLAGAAVVALEMARHPPTPLWDAGPARSMAEGRVPMGFACGCWWHQPHPCGETEQGSARLSATGSSTAWPGLALTALIGNGCIGCRPNSPAPFLIVL